MALQLYSYYRSSASYRVRIALELKKLPYEYVPIHLLNKGGEQLSESYRKINPMAQVPTLVHDGKRLSQSLPIIQYLDEVFPSYPLFPAAPYEKAKVLEICEAVNSGIQPLHNLAVLTFMGREWGHGEEDKKTWSAHWIRLGLAKIEKILETTAGTYAMGGSLTAVETFLIPLGYTARRNGVEPSEFPIFTRIENACLNMEAFKKAHPDGQPDTP
jgi:maleylacetoacetate isomerase